MYLLDTNILIYFLQGKKSVVNVLGKLKQGRFAISIASRLEFLNGLSDSVFLTEEMENYLDLFENIILEREIVKTAALLSFRTNKKLRFGDLIIAATAIVTRKTLITADKDFKRLPWVKVKFVKA